MPKNSKNSKDAVEFRKNSKDAVEFPSMDDIEKILKETSRRLAGKTKTKPRHR